METKIFKQHQKSMAEFDLEASLHSVLVTGFSEVIERLLPELISEDEITTEWRTNFNRAVETLRRIRFEIKFTLSVVAFRESLLSIDKLIAQMDRDKNFANPSFVETVQSTLSLFIIPLKKLRLEEFVSESVLDVGANFYRSVEELLEESGLVLKRNDLTEEIEKIPNVNQANLVSSSSSQKMSVESDIGTRCPTTGLVRGQPMATYKKNSEVNQLRSHVLYFLKGKYRGRSAILLRLQGNNAYYKFLDNNETAYVPNTTPVTWDCK